MKKNTLTLIITILFTISCFSQFSKTHYIPPVSGSDNQSCQIQEQFMYISTPSAIPIDFVIKEIGGTTISGTVSRDVPYVYNIGIGTDTQMHVPESSVNTILSNKGYIVEAEDLVYVTVRVIGGFPTGNQAGQITSKGLAALGTDFRIGAFVNTLTATYGDLHYTFASILATENNTTVSFTDIKPGVSLINNGASGNTPSNITLNAGESFTMAVKGPLAANADGLIGALVHSDKPIALNCGSFAGTNGELGNIDLGIDQIVSAERTGKEYIFIKSTGQDNVERVLLIAHENGTELFLNGNTGTPDYTLNAGQYIALIGSDYNANANLYVNSNKNIFAYQSVGDNSNPGSQANQNMSFVPPLSCQTPKTIDNIPFIERVGTRVFSGRVTLTTQAGATLNFIINTVPFTLASLIASGINVVGPSSVLGNPNYECYIITGLTGNVSVFSTGQLYLTAYGNSGAATFGGYYSGFTFRPEITFQQLNVALDNCLPNVELSVSSLSGFDTFQWYFNDVAISGANASSYQPTAPGYYYVSATLSVCGITLNSVKIPVSACATNTDNDGIIDNIDFDNDNDGITNCNESYGDQILNIANTSAGTVSVGAYNNSFTGAVTTSTTASTTPFVGSADGSFISTVPAGKTNFVTYTMTFTQPISLGMDYITTANPTDLLNSTAEYIVNSPINKTISVLNPTNQLLIDTNYDGIYESGVTQYSSFEIRFILNSAVALAAGTGTFRFLTNFSNTISFTHKNLSDATENKVSLKFYATCVPIDSDNDGISDQFDYDSDNDGIIDYIEAQGASFTPISNTDANNDGIDDAFGTGVTVVDSDGDGVLDYLDLDSDNDGVYDLNESGYTVSDTNSNGVIDGSNFGTNGLANNLETTPDSGILIAPVLNTDGDAINNYLELDGDDDGCNDVTDAGYTDTNGDGLLGTIAPPTVNANGVVTSGTGYVNPNPNFAIAAPITISTQPVNFTSCEQQSATFTIASNVVTSYQWQLSTDGGTTWNTITNNATYSGVTTATLTISVVTPSMSGNKFRVFLNKNGNSCGKYSTDALLTTYALPVITTPITLKQCDNDTDGISDFNLTEKNDFISTNFANETFTYFTTAAAATTNDATFLIATPTVYTSGNGSVWARVINSNGCFRVAQINLTVTVTQINSSTFHRDFTVCDDNTPNDTDGFSAFDFSSVTADIIALLPPPSSNYSITYFPNQADALAEANEITTPNNYRNVIINQQDIYVRIDSNIDNACFGLGPFITLTVEALPVAHPVAQFKECDDVTNDGKIVFNTSTLETTLLQGQTNVAVTYFDASNNPLQDVNGVFITSPFPATFETTSQTIKVRVTNTITATNDNKPCYDETTITFIVDKRPIANLIDVDLYTICDDEANPLDQDGSLSIDTSTFESLILNGQTGMIVTYTDGNGNPLSSPLPNPFITSNQNVTVTVTNPLNTSCPATLVLPFTINPIPNINLAGNELVCSNLPTFSVTIDAGINDGTPTSNYTYQWYFNGTPIPLETNYTLAVNTAGIYTVEVATIPQGCIRTRTITVVASSDATIDNVEIVDLVDINTVEIIVTNDSLGDYVYALDDEYFYQASNFFTNVPMGIHTVYIRDLNGCGVVTKEISVLGVPRYFTPNGDGFNDTWNIKGANERFYTNSIIYIFDRYGKLVKQVSAVGEGWDGTLNGKELIGDDYWYNIKFDDGRSAKGHFSLKR
jgi:gliding motility-associated-like protein